MPAQTFDIPRRLALAACSWMLMLASLAACSPTLNWREVRLDADRLGALLPCKPDQATRELPLLGPGQPAVPVSMAGCVAGGTTWAVAAARLADAGQATQALSAWQRATLAQLRVTSAAQQDFSVKPATASGTAARGVQSVARGQTASAEPVMMQAAWVVHGAAVYQAIALGERVDAAALETFMSGLVVR